MNVPTIRTALGKLCDYGSFVTMRDAGGCSCTPLHGFIDKNIFPSQGLRPIQLVRMPVFETTPVSASKIIIYHMTPGLIPVTATAYCNG